METVSFTSADDDTTDGLYPLAMGYLPPKFVRKAERELGETPETRKRGIKEIRDLIEKEPTLSNSWVTDDYILEFLRGRKFDTQRAFATVKKIMEFALKNRVYMEMLSQDTLQQAVATKAFGFLPFRDKDGCAILLIKQGNWEPAEINIKAVVRFVVLTVSYALRDPMTQVNGVKLIFDFQGNPLKYIRFCTPHYAYLMHQGALVCIPIRYKELHFINSNILLKLFYHLSYRFASEKIRKRLFFHDSPLELLKYFPRKVIPEEYGGQLKEYDNSEWYRNASLPVALEPFLKQNPEKKSRKKRRSF